MSSYNDKTEKYSFTELTEEQGFSSDLIKFFTGGRYNYSKETMLEKGADGLAEDFVEHMRYQSWNEVSALRDLTYVTNKDTKPEGKEAFGRLMQAWDNSDTAGQGFGDSIGDFAGAVLSAPSTYAGLGSFGLAKVGAKAAGKATQLAVRLKLKDALKSNVVQTGLKRNGALGVIKQSAAKGAIKEAGVGVLTGAAMGGGQAYAQGETREEVIDGYEYTDKDLLYDATIGGLIGGGIGGGLGYASGYFGRSKRIKADDFLLKRREELKAAKEEATSKAINTINKATPEAKKAAMQGVADLEDILSARAGVKGAKLKDPLDPERVAKGRALLNAISDPKADPVFSSGLSADTLRKIAAVSIELRQSGKLEVKGNDRITQSVANAMLGDTKGEVFDFLESTRLKYGLSKDDFSLIYMAEKSRAGQVLGFASAISKGNTLKAAKANADATDSATDVLFEMGASSITSREMAEMGRNAARSKSPYNPLGLPFWQDLDAMRIAAMTSQPVTTMRNLRNSGILIATDLVDETNRALYKSLTGDPKGVKDFIPRLTAVLRGYSTNGAEAKVIKEIVMEESPERYKRLYNDAMRIDVGLEGNSIMAHAGRTVNIVNTAVDSVMKEGMFYGALDRQFIDKYDSSLKDWLSINKTLDDLPEGISIEKAVEDANRFSMQRSFREDDAYMSSATKFMMKANRQLPFLISDGLGLAFPRYTGNHITMVLEYTPVIGEFLQRKGKNGRSIIARNEDTAERRARQMTGAMMLFAGYKAAEMRQGETDYGSLKNTILNTEGVAENMKPYLGAGLAHAYVGDKLYRYQKGLPLGFEWNDIQEVFGGIPDFAIDLGMVTELGNLVSKGDSEGFEKELGNLISTFTYPGTPARDVQGQLEDKAAGTPYVRDLAILPNETMESEEISNVGAKGRFGTTLKLQATRMLVDMKSIQYGQSLDGEYDIPYYSPFNPVAVASLNPVLKQFTGSPDEPPLTEIQIEMSKIGLKEWEVYSNRTAPNANVDLLLRERLANGVPDSDVPSLSAHFSNWKKTVRLNGTITYDDFMADDSVSSKRKQDVLKTYLRDKIGQEQEKVVETFERWTAKNPFKARGYIRNNYAIEQKKEGRDKFNIAAQNLGFESADDMISSSETVKEEIERRMELVQLVNRLRIPGELVTGKTDDY